MSKVGLQHLNDSALLIQAAYNCRRAENYTFTASFVAQRLQQDMSLNAVLSLVPIAYEDKGNGSVLEGGVIVAASLPRRCGPSQQSSNATQITTEPFSAFIK
eukprot:1137081-Amphidinium_carterae.1